MGTAHYKVGAAPTDSLSHCTSCSRLSHLSLTASLTHLCLTRCFSVTASHSLSLAHFVLLAGMGAGIVGPGFFRSLVRYMFMGSFYMNQVLLFSLVLHYLFAEFDGSHFPFMKPITRHPFAIWLLVRCAPPEGLLACSLTPVLPRAVAHVALCSPASPIPCHA